MADQLAPLPVHALAASHRYVVLLTAGNVVVFDREIPSLQALDARVDPNAPVGDASDAQQLAFPRLCAISPSESYIAVAGDDKTLRVWRLGSVQYGDEVLLEKLPKRAGTLQWTTCSTSDGSVGEEVVVADKFGDLYRCARAHRAYSRQLPCR